MKVQVTVPSQLRRYTRGQADVVAEGETLDEVLHDLDRQFPGFRFRVIDEQNRVRRHIILYVGEEREDDLSRPMQPGLGLFIIGALSGG